MPSVEDRKWLLVAHLLSFSIFDCSKVSKCCFLSKIITLSRQFWTLGVASLRFYLDLWRGMLCKIENDFYSIVGFHCEYLRTQKLGNFVFYIQQHVWADTILKSGCGHCEILHSLIEVVVA